MGDVVAVEALIAQRVEDRQSQLGLGRHLGRDDEILHRLEVRRVRLVRREALLDLGHLQQLARADQARQLADERDVLGHVAAELADLGVRLDEALHVGDGLDLAAAGRRRPRLVVGDIRLDVGAEVAKVVVEVPRKERVLLGREHDFLRRQSGPGE